MDLSALKMNLRKEEKKIERNKPYRQTPSQSTKGKKTSGLRTGDKIAQREGRYQLCSSFWAAYGPTADLLTPVQ